MNFHAMLRDPVELKPWIWVLNFYAWILKKILEQVKENMVNECVQKWKGKSINFTQFLQICAVFLFSFFRE